MKVHNFLRSLFLLLTAASSIATAQTGAVDSPHCGSEVGGLRLCLERLEISVKSPETVVLQLWIENTGKERLLIQRGNFFNYLYEAKIIDQNGRHVPSFYEIAEEKKKRGTLSPEEGGKLLRLCCMGSLPSHQTIEPQEKKLANILLSGIYEFKAKTSYTVEIKRIEPAVDGENRILIPLPVVKVRIE